MILRSFVQKFTILVICFYVFVVFFATTTRAQVDSLKISVIPEHPGPYENVSISVEDYIRNLNGMDISWSVNGKVESRAVGQKRFNLRTGSLGTVSNVVINMGGISKSLNIRPAVVDLRWQSDSYTPPFYRGKALHSNQDPITVVAEPFFVTNSQGARIDPDTLIYKWKQNDKINNNASGYGKKTFKIFPSILLKPIIVSVEVSTTDGTFISKGTIGIPDSPTETVMYENHPLYGIIFERALNGKELTLKNKEVSLIGIPYFFSRQQKDFSGLDYSWTLNNNPVAQRENEVIFRKPDGATTGRSSISLSVKNPERFMQSSSASLHVVFNDEPKESVDSAQSIF